jgi:hypothetical protein
MPFSFATRPGEDHLAHPTGTPETRLYSTDLLHTMRGLLPTVADLGARYEIERKQIEKGPGSEKDKQRRLAELRVVHEHRRGLHEARWAELHPGGHCTPLRPPI